MNLKKIYKKNFLVVIPARYNSSRLPGKPLIKIAGALVALSIIINVVLHLITLDVEFDASYKRALPILKEKIPCEYFKSCNTVLTAAAFTYVVGSLASFLSLRYAWPIIRKIFR